MENFNYKLEERKFSFVSNTDDPESETPDPVVVTEEVEEDVRPGGHKEDNPKK